MVFILLSSKVHTYRGFALLRCRNSKTLVASEASTHPGIPPRNRNIRLARLEWPRIDDGWRAIGRGRLAKHLSHRCHQDAYSGTKLEWIKAVCGLVGLWTEDCQGRGVEGVVERNGCNHFTRLPHKRSHFSGLLVDNARYDAYGSKWRRIGRVNCARQRLCHNTTTCMVDPSKFSTSKSWMRVGWRCVRCRLLV